MTGSPLVSEFTEAAQDVHDAVLHLQEVAEKITEHASRMRSMSDALMAFKTSLDTPGEIMSLPTILTRQHKDGAAA